MKIRVTKSDIEKIEFWNVMSIWFLILFHCRCYSLTAAPACLLHHSSLSILGNAFLAPSRLAEAERARSDPDIQPGPVFWLQPPSCSPVEEVNFADGAAFCEGEANKTPKLQIYIYTHTQETSGDSHSVAVKRRCTVIGEIAPLLPHWDRHRAPQTW